MKYYPGLAIPGSEERTTGLEYRQIVEALDVAIVAGTFNVNLVDDVSLGDAVVRTEKYALWPCVVSTEERVRAEEEGYRGWIIKVFGEDLPDNFVEIVSDTHFRDALKKKNWPAFAVEVSI